LRGFPPAPGAPDPVYPPGQFSPWNPPAVRSAGPGGRPGAGSWPNGSEPGYSLLAVSDPSADMTATQAWAVLDEAQLGDGWATSLGADDPSAAVGAGPGLSPGGAGVAGPDTAGPWPPTAAEDPPGDPAEDPAGAWPGRPAAGAGGPLPGSAWPPAGGRWADRDAGDGDAPVSSPWPAPEAATAYQAGPETMGRHQAAAQATALPQDARAAGGDGPGRPRGEAGTRVSRAAARGRKPRKHPSRARMWLLPIFMVLAVGALVTVVYLHFVKGHAARPQASAPARTAAASASPTPSLGPWKHITTRAEDSVPLTLTELFPARFSSGGTIAAETIGKAGTNCPAAVLGAGLQSAVRKAGCTQVMRASYLTTDQHIMGTIGVLNLVDATSAQRAGQATGSAEFIDQLPAAKGPTHNLTKGTGLEEAVYKGHYLILIWAEFTNLRAPTTAAQRAELRTFSDNLVSGTANVSLTSRMVIGKPQAP
jgi:hypothetical protein